MCVILLYLKDIDDLICVDRLFFPYKKLCKFLPPAVLPVFPYKKPCKFLPPAVLAIHNMDWLCVYLLSEQFYH